MISVLTVYGSVTVGGWICLPLIARLFPDMKDRGAGIARLIALFFAAYLSWLLACVGFGQASFWSSAIVIAIAGAISWWGWHAHMVLWLRTHWRTIVVIELSGLLVYGCLLIYRGWTSDTGAFGEKYMDQGIVNSILLMPQVPPRNMWFGGRPINYYYMGHWVLALLIRISGMPPSYLVTFATPIIAALCTQCYLSLLSSLLPDQKLRWSLLGCYVLLFCGPLNDTIIGILHWNEEWQKPFSTYVPQILGDGLSPLGNQFEVPASSLLWGEMHAHFIGIPAMLIGLALLAQRIIDSDHRATISWIVTWCIVLGNNYTINTWQYPTLFILYVILIWWQKLRWSKRLLIRSFLEPMIVILGSLLSIWPFLKSFETFSWATLPESPFQPLPFPLGRVLVWSPVGTTIAGLIASVGLPFLLGASGLIALLCKKGWLWLTFACIIGLFSGIFRPTGIMLVPVIIIGVWLSFHKPHTIAFGSLLMAFSALIILACDYILIPDWHWSRSNTIFKYYLQAWVLFTLAAFVVFVPALQKAVQQRWLHRSLLTLLLLLVICGSIYPVLRGRQWLRYQGDRWWGLDGMAQIWHYYPDEAAAIMWLQQQPTTAGVLESHSNGSLKTDGRTILRASHMSAFTGRPTPVGWVPGHIGLWHNSKTNQTVQKAIDDDSELMLEFPKTNTITDVYILMQKYDLAYVLYGRIERQQWGDKGRTLLAQHLPLVWQSGNVFIFGRPSKLPVLLAWIPSTYWSETERSAGVRQPFRWMEKQAGNIHVFSQQQVVIEISFEILESVDSGVVSVWKDSSRLLEMEVKPQQAQRRKLLFHVNQGETVLDIRTTVVPKPYEQRTMTIAVAQPTIRCMARCP